MRVGCVACDWVGDMRPATTEDRVHYEACPRCGERRLHGYPVVGSWPSDYDLPPCDLRGDA